MNAGQSPPPAVTGVSGGPGLIERWLPEPNAIWMREMRQSARLARTPWVLFGLTLLIALLMCSIGGLTATHSSTPAAIGGALFQVFFSLAFLIVVLVGPAVAANGIASEREGRTWEAVQLTGLEPKDVARGKFMAAYTTIALYIVTLAPVGALSFLFGGVTATEVIVAFVFLFLFAGLAVAFGLAVSSLMSSLRGALVATLFLAIVVGPLLYFIFGFAASFGIHKLWSEVPEGFPIWLPLAYSRGSPGLEYALVLVATPILTVATPAWFLYEVTVANLSGSADDRSTGLKRWFFFCTPLVAILSALPSAVADDDRGRVELGVLGLSCLSLFLAFAAFLFVAEPPGPSRRVRVHWDRAGAGFFKRFFGPGLPKTAMLVTVMGFGAIWLVAFGEMGLTAAFAGSARMTTELIQQIFFFALYAAGFFVFVVGLTAWLRSRGQTPWVARMVGIALLFLVVAGPWVVVAIGGAIAERHGDDWVLVAAPSPFFELYVMSWLEPGRARSETPVVEISALFSLLWGLGGITLLVAATQRSHRMVRERDAAVASAEAALRAEEVTSEGSTAPTAAG